jgi:hypothetical protein
MKDDSSDFFDPWLPDIDKILGDNAGVTLTSINDVKYDRYSGLEIISVYRMGNIYHCETKCDKYLWFEAHMGSLVMCLAETAYELGENSEPVSKYFGGKPTLNQIIKHMKWEINEEDIWNG